MKRAVGDVGVGVGLSYSVTRLLESLLFGVKANSPLTFATVAAVLTMVAVLATPVPARSASSVQPVGALRYQ